MLWDTDILVWKGFRIGVFWNKWIFWNKKNVMGQEYPGREKYRNGNILKLRDIWEYSGLKKM